MDEITPVKMKYRIGTVDTAYPGSKGERDVNQSLVSANTNQGDSLLLLAETHPLASLFLLDAYFFVALVFKRLRLFSLNQI